MLLPLLLLQSRSGSNVAAAGFDTRPVQHCAFGGGLPVLLVPNRDAAVVPLDRHYPATRLSHVCGCVVLVVVVRVFAVFAVVVFAAVAVVVVAAVVAPPPPKKKSSRSYCRWCRWSWVWRIVVPSAWTS